MSMKLCSPLRYCMASLWMSRCEAFNFQRHRPRGTFKTRTPQSETLRRLRADWSSIVPPPIYYVMCGLGACACKGMSFRVDVCLRPVLVGEPLAPPPSETQATRRSTKCLIRSRTHPLRTMSPSRRAPRHPSTSKCVRVTFRAGDALFRSSKTLERVTLMCDVLHA
ncbi:hypothetical protein C8Q79DRAFT_175590 [Trametes meyenii]|nr:hypothetical protein C8Q79DRAFT_175590 [Trametes meyenii]